MLKLKNIEKTFEKGTTNEKKALKRLDFHAQKGDFITIIGSNGAGKSTLFNLVGGSFFADCGNIFLDNKNITFVPDYIRSKQIGRMFQDPLSGTAPNMTIFENLTLSFLTDKKRTFGGLIKREEKKILRDKVASLGLGLEDRMNERVGRLSGGERQALTLLMATIVTPKLLLLDEHTAALDPSTAKKILELTEKTVKENNLTCLMITHNLSQAIKMGNRTIMMANGEIILDIKGKERENMSEQDLINKFNTLSSSGLSDRVLLKEVKRT